MARYGSGSVPIATGWKCTNCRRTHRSSIPRSASGNTRARPALTTDTSRPPRNWSAPCPGSSERCNTILSQSDPICFLFADRYVPLIMRGCICRRRASFMTASLFRVDIIILPSISAGRLRQPYRPRILKHRRENVRNPFTYRNSVPKDWQTRRGRLGSRLRPVTIPLSRRRGLISAS